MTRYSNEGYPEAHQESKTPRTDDSREVWVVPSHLQLGDGRPVSGNVVDVEFSRTLERELSEANEKLASLQSGYEALQGRYDGLAAEMASKLASRDEHIRRLKEALEDIQVGADTFPGYSLPDVERIAKAALAYDPEMGF